jgi:hypothetical protein
MRRLEKPSVDPGEVYDACVSGITDPVLAAKFIAARSAFVASCKDYGLRASTHQLFSLVASDRAKGGQPVIAGMNKQEFVELYIKQMVDDRKPGRGYYDQLLMLAPLGLCPFCGFGHAKTLDHFLSKARYPAFSILCANLVPACADCNTCKGASVVMQNTQMLHPYFEEQSIENEPWLFAEVVESVPATVRYFIQPPGPWHNDLIQRVTNHFNKLDLAKRFAVQADAELAGLGHMLSELKARDMIQAHLSCIARAERKIRRNSWKAALFDALVKSEWFQGGGYCNLRC